MCDTFVALPNYTVNGQLIMGKNSDREPNEAQAIVRYPAQKQDKPTVKCTFIEIPQVSHTHEVILSKPFHMWGAEMGVNEHGVVIGNEAVFTKVKKKKNNDGLTGMDMLRLALERSTTADEALHLICNLLETYGQDACGGYENKNFFYHNSFIIADKSGAWILETADIHWVALRVKDYGAISNGLSIGTDYDLISNNAIDYALHKRWLKRGENFNFRKCYSDWLYTKVSNCHIRRKHSIHQATPNFDIYMAMDILRSHEVATDKFTPSSSSSASICMHATGLLNPSQTAGSMIVELHKGQPPTVWLTGTSMPCISIFKPFYFESDVLSQAQMPHPTSVPDSSLWWQAERVHRLICKDYIRGKKIINNDRDTIQKELVTQDISLRAAEGSLKEKNRLSENAITAHLQALDRWGSALAEESISQRSLNPIYRIFRYHTDKVLSKGH